MLTSTSSSLLHKTETGADALRERFKVGVGETHKANENQSVIFVCYACYPQNCGHFERFENKKSSSRRVRTAGLRAF